MTASGTNYIVQNVEIGDPTLAGVASYTFTNSIGTNLVVLLSVDAPTGANNSIFVNGDDNYYIMAAHGANNTAAVNGSGNQYVYANSGNNNTAIVNGDGFVDVRAEGGNQYVVVPSA